MLTRSFSADPSPEAEPVATMWLTGFVLGAALAVAGAAIAAARVDAARSRRAGELLDTAVVWFRLGDADQGERCLCEAELLLAMVHRSDRFAAEVARIRAHRKDKKEVLDALRRAMGGGPDRG